MIKVTHTIVNLTGNRIIIYGIHQLLGLFQEQMGRNEIYMSCIIIITLQCDQYLNIKLQINIYIYIHTVYIYIYIYIFAIEILITL